MYYTDKTSESGGYNSFVLGPNPETPENALLLAVGKLDPYYLEMLFPKASTAQQPAGNDTNATQVTSGLGLDPSLEALYQKYKPFAEVCACYGGMPSF
jgi:hypothetical protein